MPRTLDTKTLDQAAIDYAAMFVQPDQKSSSGETFVTGPSRVMQDFCGAHYKDEFEYWLAAIRGELGKNTLVRFDALAKEHFKPRDDATLAKELADRQAITPSGEHIEGKIGSVIVGTRVVGSMLKPFKGSAVIKNLYWNIYAGETEERLAGSKVPDELPDSVQGMPVGALDTRISNDLARAMVDEVITLLDIGSLGGVIQGRNGGQPADPDTAVTGTNLFTLTLSATSFPASADGAPGGLLTANAITDDTSADFTSTLGYCRASASSVADTPLAGEDHIDGEAGTSGADFNFNTLAIVSGATVSMTTWTITQPET